MKNTKPYQVPEFHFFVSDKINEVFLAGSGTPTKSFSLNSYKKDSFQ